MKKTILITGGLGFIGFSTIMKMNDEFNIICVDNFDPFYSVKIKENRLKKLETLKNFKFYKIDICCTELEKPFNDYKIDLVIHLASKANVVESNKFRAEYIHNNLIGYFNLLNIMEKNSVKKIVMSSSSSVYGDNSKAPFIDDYDLSNCPISIYASTKRQNEIMTYTYFKSYGIDALMLRFFTVYGPEQRPDLAINKFITKLKNGDAIEIYGNLNKMRDFTYIDDIVKGIFLSVDYLLSHSKVFDVINLGSGNPITLSKLISTIEKSLNKKAELKFVPPPTGDVVQTYASIEKAKKLINWSPKIGFEEGINNYIQWLGKNDD